MTFRVATLPGNCPSCRRNIRKGEIIALVDARWLHLVCASIYTPSFAAYVCRATEALAEIAWGLPDKEEAWKLAWTGLYGADEADAFFSRLRPPAALGVPESHTGRP